jgi:hypothetical protein
MQILSKVAKIIGSLQNFLFVKTLRSGGAAK